MHPQPNRIHSALRPATLAGIAALTLLVGTISANAHTDAKRELPPQPRLTKQVRRSTPKTRPTLSKPRTPRQKTDDEILEAAATYWFYRLGRANNDVDPANQQHSYICQIDPSLGTPDAVLIAQLKKRDILVKGREWPHVSSGQWPVTGFQLMAIGSLTHLSARRACVNAWLAGGTGDPNVVREANGTFYLNYVGRHWVIDQKHSRIQYGGE